MKVNFFVRIPNFSQSLNILKIFQFLALIILKLFLNIEDVATSENQRIVCKSLLMFYFIIMIKENKSETEKQILYRL